MASKLKSEALTVFAALASLALIACDGLGDRIEREPTPASMPVPTAAVPVVSEATLPTLAVIHEGGTVPARRYQGCWTPDSSSELECVETSPLGERSSYAEVDNGDRIEVEIDPYSRPDRLIATFFTHPGEVMAGGLLHLPPGRRGFVVDLPPGTYNVRLHAQWFEGGSEVRHKASHVFGIRVPGEPELTVECASTLIGGIMGIVLESPDDPLRTAVDPFNSSGCRFNKPIAQVRLVLDGGAGRRYTETFRIDPPSVNVPLPVPEDAPSTREGGPPPPGQYSRRIAVVAEDGTEQDLDLGDTGGVVNVVAGPPETAAPVRFPQHPEGRRTYASALPDHIEGRLKVYRGCIYIRNGTIPVWPSDFGLRTDGDLVQVLDEGGEVAAVADEDAVLAGYRVGADDPAGRKIGATLPPACPPGNFWIVGDEIGDLKEQAERLVVPLEGSSLVFPRQSPGMWRDDLSSSTEGELVREGDCLRLRDAAGHMVVWPPLHSPRLSEGAVEVRDGDGVAVARVGDRLEMTGFGSELMRPRYADRCPGPYWIAGRISRRR